MAEPLHVWKNAPKPRWRSNLEYFLLGLFLGVLATALLLWFFGFVVF